MQSSTLASTASIFSPAARPTQTSFSHCHLSILSIDRCLQPTIVEPASSYLRRSTRTLPPHNTPLEVTFLQRESIFCLDIHEKKGYMANNSFIPLAVSGYSNVLVSCVPKPSQDCCPILMCWSSAFHCSPTLNVDEFMHQWRGRVQVINNRVRKLLAKWITEMTSIPNINMVRFFPDVFQACSNGVLRIDLMVADGLVNRENRFKVIGRVSEAIQDYARPISIRPPLGEIMYDINMHV